MDETYTITVKNYDEKMPIEASMHKVTKARAMSAANYAFNSFSKVEVIEESTGTVIISHYTDPEWFLPGHEPGEAIDTLHTICYGVY